MVFKDFSDTLRENLNSFEDDYASFIDYGPDLFVLLCDILDYRQIGKKYRLEIGAAISYFVVPNDVIPEEIYGPYGYIDDIFVSVYIIRKIGEKYGYDFIQEAWNHENDVKDVVDECYDKSLELLEDKVYPILAYCGLVD